MKLIELLDHFAGVLEAGRGSAGASGSDAPVAVTGGRLLDTAGTLHLYQLEVPDGAALMEDVPVTVLPSGDLEPTEGVVLACSGTTLLVQTFDAFGQNVGSATIVPDTSGFFETTGQRLAGMARHPEKYTLGAAERLVPWIDPNQSASTAGARDMVSSAVLTPMWAEDLSARRAKLAALAIEQIRANKRLLVISPDHATSDELVGAIARAMRGAGLQFKSLVSRYEMPLGREAGGMALPELGFEAQMHRFYAKSRGDKAALRRKYERFRELTPLLAYKAEKQRDLDEVKLLEWRLLTQLSDLQGQIKEIDQTLAEYEELSLWKRLGMQTTGKNVTSLHEYRVIYEGQVKETVKELDTAKARINELRPQAAIPKDIRPEYNELKEEVLRLGGTKKIRELLAAEEGTNRQAFIQNKRLVATTAARAVADPLFDRVRFDILLADEAPRIPSPYLLAVAGLVRERIVLSGDQRDLPTSADWASLERRAVGQPTGS